MTTIVQERVHGIVAEAFHEDYWYAASRDGNRTTHYRGGSRFSTQTRRIIIRLNCTAGRCGYPEPTAFRLAR